MFLILLWTWYCLDRMTTSLVLVQGHLQEDTGSGVARRVREAQSGEQKERKCQGRVTIPYIQSVSKEIRRVLGLVNITTHFRDPMPGPIPSQVPERKENEAECGQCGEVCGWDSAASVKTGTSAHPHSSRKTELSSPGPHVCDQACPRPG